MKTVTSISGGMTSAYLATHFPTDHNVFSLVRVDDEECRFKDEKVRKQIEDRIQKPFIGTVEDDVIIYTILDLEQHLGKEINIVSGISFDEVVRTKGGWLPNKLHRYCTTEMKLIPIFEWWYKNFDQPVVMNIGYRGNEGRRVKKMNERLNDNGLLEIKATVRKRPDGRNHWEVFEWQSPRFPLYDARINRDKIVNYWKTQSVRFAVMNNCVGCFHRNPILLRKMFDEHPEKMEWFASQERANGGQWRSDMSYDKIKNHRLQIEIGFDDFTDCDSGLCGY